MTLGACHGFQHLSLNQTLYRIYLSRVLSALVLDLPRGSALIDKDKCFLVDILLVPDELHLE